MRVALLAVCAMVATAAAGPKRKLHVVSNPDKASVYIDAVEDGEKCKTPCDVEIQQEQTLIVAKAGFKPAVDTIIWGKTDRAPYKRNYDLAPNNGHITVKGPAGASVSVDGEDKGKAPCDFDVTADEPHAVTVKNADGSSAFADSVEVKAGDNVEVVGRSGKPTGKQIGTKPDPIDGGEETKPDPGITKGTPAPPRTDKLFALSAAFSVGFRSFSYDNATDPSLNPATENGQVTAGAQLELWVGTIAGIKALHGLALVGRYQHNVNSQVVQQNGADLNATTFWRQFEVSLRQRWVIGDVAAVEASAGFVEDQHTYGGDTNDIMLVPDATYDSIRIGGRAALLLGKLEPYVGVENRVVLSGGALEDRLKGSANGVAAALGIAGNFGSIGARLEASLARYSWTFETGATGATDSTKYISLTLGYAY